MFTVNIWFPQGGAIQYSGDPLQDFTLIRFLDRFVFRNPKQLKGKRETIRLCRTDADVVHEYLKLCFFCLVETDAPATRRLPVSSLPGELQHICLFLTCVFGSQLITLCVRQ